MAGSDGGIYPRGFSPTATWPWPLTKARDLVVLNYGKALQDGERRPGTIPVYGTNGRCGWHDTPLADGPGVILGRKGQGPLGVEWCDGGYWVIDTAYFVTTRTPQIDLKYFYYLVKYVGLNHLKDGTSNPSLSRNTFADLLLPTPPLSTQRAIAHILGTLDDKIDLNRRMNETLEAMARALFRSWFVDFDPVRAKAEGRDPCLAKPLADVFPDGFECSDGTEVPFGWRRAPLGDWVRALSGGTPSKKEASLWGGSIPWISPKVMSSIHAVKAEHHVFKVAIGNGTQLAPKGSTLVMVRGMGLHQQVRVSQARRSVAFNQDVKALVGTAIESVLLLWGLLDAQEYLLGRVESSGHGTGVLPTGVLLGYPITMPTPDCQARLAPAFDRMNDRIAACAGESETLGSIRDTLLPGLVSGEVRVRQAEKIVETAL
jgi:type I restriction enzyme S subunit